MILTLYLATKSIARLRSPRLVSSLKRPPVKQPLQLVGSLTLLLQRGCFGRKKNLLGKESQQDDGVTRWHHYTYVMRVLPIALLLQFYSQFAWANSESAVCYETLDCGGMVKSSTESLPNGEPACCFEGFRAYQESGSEACVPCQACSLFRPSVLLAPTPPSPPPPAMAGISAIMTAQHTDTEGVPSTAQAGNVDKSSGGSVSGCQAGSIAGIVVSSIFGLIIIVGCTVIITLGIVAHFIRINF